MTQDDPVPTQEAALLNIESNEDLTEEGKWHAGPGPASLGRRCGLVLLPLVVLALLGVGICLGPPSILSASKGLAIIEDVEIPDYCQEKRKPDLGDCMEECYKEADEAAAAAAREELAWGIGDAILDTATAVIPLKGAVDAGIGFARGVVGAARDYHDATKDGPEDCTVLNAEIQQLKLTMIDQKLDEVNGKLDTALDKMDDLSDEIAATQTLISNVFKHLSRQLDNMNTKQNALLGKVDEVISKVDGLAVLNKQNLLTAQMTEYLTCAGKIQHSYDQLQRVRSEKVALERQYKVGRGNWGGGEQARSGASEWLQDYETWRSNAIPSTDETVVHALDGLGCMSSQVGSGEMLTQYYRGRTSLHIQELMEEGTYGSDAKDLLGSIFKIGDEAAKEVFLKDDILLMALNSLSQVRKLLLALPGQGYWTSFASYALEIKSGFDAARSTYAPQEPLFMALVQEALGATAVLVSPPPSSCVGAIIDINPQVVSTSLSLFETKASQTFVAQGIERSIITDENVKPDLSRSTWFSCLPPGSCWTPDTQTFNLPYQTCGSPCPFPWMFGTFDEAYQACVSKMDQGCDLILRSSSGSRFYLRRSSEGASIKTWPNYVMRISCTKKATWQAKAIAAPEVPANFGLSHAPPDPGYAAGSDPNEVKARLFLNARAESMVAWGCRAADLGARSDAVAKTAQCLGTNAAEKTMWECYDAGTVKCPEQSWPARCGEYLWHCPVLKWKTSTSAQLYCGSSKNLLYKGWVAEHKYQIECQTICAKTLDCVGYNVHVTSHGPYECSVYKDDCEWNQKGSGLAVAGKIDFGPRDKPSLK
eukprot:TRINITY_DN4465_c1_g1_i3.p1 TRINITY_DN4465_c1_g1~~TRINITY_DN4465_c1_g1_i3.p1  ORF type:complete len:820 (+),score=129.28 TRINITY_DN4465_c1_g1_i3:206-2665(+)